MSLWSCNLSDGLIGLEAITKSNLLQRSSLGVLINFSYTLNKVKHIDASSTNLITFSNLNNS